MLNRDALFAAIDRGTGAGEVGSEGFAVAAVHIRDLRQIALRFGCARGDRAEAGIERRIRESLRSVDLVFRAGDEVFAVVLPGLRSQNHALLAATKLSAAFEQPLDQDDSPWQVRPVMGLALFPRDGHDADTLWRCAQMACEAAKRGGEPWAFHDPHGARKAIDYHDLRDGIESNHLRTFFQPIWRLPERRIAGAESLVRWTSPVLGEVRPDDFVTFAEQNDLILPLTRWSINSTFRHAAKLADAFELMFALNLSPRVLSRTGLTEQMTDALNIWGVPPRAVVVEVTETALANDMSQAVRALRELRDLGMHISIDDFGTGYASITYLSKFPATDLKIDKSLVGVIISDPRMAKLVESIVKLAHHMDLTTTAEGIEDEDTQKMLTDMGCDFGQGYHLGKPQPAEDFVARFSLHETID